MVTPRGDTTTLRSRPIASFSDETLTKTPHPTRRRRWSASKVRKTSRFAQGLADFRIQSPCGGMAEWSMAVVLKTDHRHFSFPLFFSQVFESVCLSARGDVVS